MVVPVVAYNELLPITTAKRNDLLALCRDGTRFMKKVFQVDESGSTKIDDESENTYVTSIRC